MVICVTEWKYILMESHKRMIFSVDFNIPYKCYSYTQTVSFQIKLKDYDILTQSSVGSNDLLLVYLCLAGVTFIC